MSQFTQSLKEITRKSERTVGFDSKYVLKSGFWTNTHFAVSSIIAIVLAIVLANTLSAEQYGVYQFALTLLGIFTAFTVTGSNTAITQSVARGFHGTLHASIPFQLRWNIIPASAALLLALWYAIDSQFTLSIIAVLIAGTLPILATYSSYAAYLSGISDFKKISIYGIGTTTLYTALILLCVVFIPLALPIVAINIIVSSAAAWFLYKKVSRSIPRSDADVSANSYAKHLSIMNAAGQFAAQIDNILVFKLLGPATLAVYALAKLVPERAGSLFKIVTFSIALPRFSKHSYAEVKALLPIRTATLLIAVIVAMVAYIYAAPWIFSLAFPTYSASVPLSQLLALTLVMYVSGLASSVLYAHKKIDQLYVLTIGLPITQVVLQVIGILGWGLIGLIVGRIIAASITSIATLYVTWRLA